MINKFKKYNFFDEEVKKFNNLLKELKKDLPKQCSFLALLRLKGGEYVIKAMICRLEYHYSIPQSFDLTEADWRRIEKLIRVHCNPVSI